MEERKKSGFLQKALETHFIPYKKEPDLSFMSFLKRMAKGEFDKRMFLGINCDNAKYWVENFRENPHLLIVGGSGTGKSGSGSTIVTLNMLINPHRTIVFLNDAVKSADDYSSIKGLSNVYEATISAAERSGISPEEMIKRVVDLASSEIDERARAFTREGVNDIDAYEAKTGEEVSRVLLIYEEFHAIPEKILNFSKEYQEPFTPAAKFFNIMRAGRSFGVWVIAISQRSTKSDFPTEIVSNFLNKIYFNVTSGESVYVFGDRRASDLNGKIKGRGVTPEFPVHVPFLSQAKQKEVINHYIDKSVGCTSRSFFLEDEKIRKYLSGGSTIELLRIRSKTEITKSISKLQGEVVVNVLHEGMGHEYEQIDPNRNIAGICGRGVDNRGDSFIVGYAGAKISDKMMTNMNRMIREEGIKYGIIYCTQAQIPATKYKMAIRSKIKILDIDDIERIGIMLDEGLASMAEELIDKIANVDGDGSGERDNNDSFDDGDFQFRGYERGQDRDSDDEPTPPKKPLRDPKLKLSVDDGKGKKSKCERNLDDIASKILSGLDVDIPQEEKKETSAASDRAGTQTDPFNKAIKPSSRKIIEGRIKRGSAPEEELEDIQNFFKKFIDD